MIDLPRTGLPKRWQKFGDLLLIPNTVEVAESDFEQLCKRFKVSRIAQQNKVSTDEVRTPGAKLLLGMALHNS